MKPNRIVSFTCVLALAVFAGSAAWAQSAGAGQEPAAPSTPRLHQESLAAVPRLIKFTGVLQAALGEPRTGTAGLTFALYAEPEGGAPLWLETQNVALDADGRYTVLLGATQREGLPLKLFAASEARWLEIQVAGEPPQPRILLVSVPYALKAEEAEKLAGKSASEFVLAEELKTPEGQEKLGLTGGGGNSAAAVQKATRFKATTATGPGFIWDGTSGPPLRVGSTALVANLNADLLDSLDSADLQRRVAATCPAGESIRIIATDGTVTCEPDDVGVSSGGTVMQIDTGAGLTGGPITSTGTVSLDTTFTDALYVLKAGDILTGNFDVTGTLRAVNDNAASFRLRGPSDLVGDDGVADSTSQSFAGIFYNAVFNDTGGTGAKNTRVIFGSNEDMDLELNGSNHIRLTAVDDNVGTGRIRLAAEDQIQFHTYSPPFGPGGANAETDSLDMRITDGLVEVFGTVNATNFVGDGSGLTNLPVGGTATDLNCTNCVSAAEVQFNYAGSTSEGGLATNADLLDSLNSTQFARVDTANSFSGTQAAPNFAATSSVTGASGSFSGSAATAVTGSTSSPFGIGVQGSVSDPTGVTLGMFASSASSSGTGIQARASSASGVTKGVEGIVDSASGTAGVFENTAGGAILIGKGSSGALKLTVDGQGNLTAQGNVKLGPSGGLFAASGPENLRVLRGLVNSDGTVVNGTGFTVTRNGTGDYTVTFSTDFSAAPTPVVTGHSTLGVIANVSDLLTGSFRVQTFVIQALSGATLAADSPFTFIVMGPR